MLPSKQKFNIIATYTLYISNNPNTSTMNSRCDLNVGFSVSQAATGNEDVIHFPIDVIFNLISVQCHCQLSRPQHRRLLRLGQSQSQVLRRKRHPRLHPLHRSRLHTTPANPVHSQSLIQIRNHFQPQVHIALDCCACYHFSCSVWTCAQVLYQQVPNALPLNPCGRGCRRV